MRIAVRLKRERSAVRIRSPVCPVRTRGELTSKGAARISRASHGAIEAAETHGPRRHGWTDWQWTGVCRTTRGDGWV